jgi:hypothetical protein
MIGHDDSIKDFQVEATDGDAGKVSWASYAPGESYLVISLRHHLHETHHVVPAAAVEKDQRFGAEGVAPLDPERGRAGSWASRPGGTARIPNGRRGDRDGDDLAPEGVGALPVSHASTGLR